MYPNNSLHGLAISVFTDLHMMPNCLIRIMTLSTSFKCARSCLSSIWWSGLPLDRSYHVAIVTSSTYTIHRHRCKVKVSSTCSSIRLAAKFSSHCLLFSWNSRVLSSVTPISVFFNISSEEQTPLCGYGA